MKSGPLWQIIALGALSCCAAIANGAPVAASCTPSRLSLQEAETLLESTPALSALRDADGDPRPVEESGAHPREFFHFVVYDTGPAGASSADGGLVGYFAVQKDTAKVFDTVLIEELDGVALRSQQSKLRETHCVTAEVLHRWRDEWP